MNTTTSLEELSVIDDEIKALTKAKEILTEFWRQVLPEFTPPEQQFWVWLQLHSPRTLEMAILRTAKKFQKVNGAMNGDYLVKFTSSVANNISRQESAEHKCA